MPSLVGTQQIDESTWRGGFVRIDLMDGTDRDTLTAFDTGITGFGEVEEIFGFFHAKTPMEFSVMSDE
jgi:hypothetical protein